MATNSNVYGTIDDIQDVLSAQAVTLRLDDIPPDDYANAFSKASNQIEKYLFRRYTPTSLMASPLVTDWWAVLAAFFLCSRRGNPVPIGISHMYENTIADLKEVQKGWNEIPGIAARNSYAPVLSKMRATQRPFPRAVVERSMSTTLGGTPQGAYVTANQDVWDAYGWNSQAFLQYSF